MYDLKNLSTQQVGRCGEVLVQFELLKHGIDSAPMTTDVGIDLVALNPKTKDYVTIQVKTSSSYEDGTSRWVDWNMRKTCIAEYVATVDLKRNKIWMFTKEKFEVISTRTGKESRRLWWYIPGHRPKTSTLSRFEEHFKKDDIESVIPVLFDS